MPFSHHSHSGQFCHHATNTLEEMVQAAISKRMSIYCVTEHMPREEQDLYPEEVEVGKKVFAHTEPKQTSAYLFRLFDDFYHEAIRLRDKYASDIDILIGMEIDWIRSDSRNLIQALIDKYQLDLFVGSVHHVHAIPIDYSHEFFRDAQRRSDGLIEKLYEDYFDHQHDMLKALKPHVVGHLDLIRLKSDNPNGSFKPYPRVWEKILRNVDLIVGYGGVIELNSAALRKGTNGPYPNEEICKEVIARGGLITLSDDAHSTEQVGKNYAQALSFAERVGILNIAYLKRDSPERNDQRGCVTVHQTKVAAIKAHPLFTG